MNVEFQFFQSQDLPEVEQMMFQLYEEDLAGQPMTAEKIRGTVDELTRHPEKGRIIIFRLGPAMAGYAILIFYWSNEFGGNVICIDELYVKKSWRRQGIATQFFEYLAGYEDIKGLQLEVTPSNRRGLAFYQKLNFQLAENTHLFKQL